MIHKLIGGIHLKKRFKLPILTTLVCFSFTSLVYAKTFTDVDDSYWGKSYIDHMSNVGIIQGYDDGTFKPDESVSNIQSIVMMARMYGIDSAKAQEIQETYQDLLDELSIPSWYEKDTAIALATNIIQEEELRKMYQQNQLNIPVKKEEICVYLTRALGLEDEATQESVFLFPYTDTFNITQAAQPYVNMMLEKEILSRNGDGTGKFLPKSEVTRAVLTKMLSVAYDLMETENIEPEYNQTSYGVAVTVTDTIQQIVSLIDDTYCYLENGDMYKISENVQIEQNDRTLSLSQLKEGSSVTLTIDGNNVITKIDVHDVESEYTGIIKSIIQTNNPIITIEYEDDDVTKSYTVSNSAKITLDGEFADLREIQSGDSATIKISNDKVIAIDAKNKTKELSGTMVSVDYGSRIYLVIENEDNEEVKYEISDDIDVDRNNRNSNLSELKRGDELGITLEYDQVVEIDATGKRDEVEGTLKSITIGSPSEIRIVDEDGDLHDYTVSNGATIRIDGDYAEFKDLSVGYDVEIRLESDEVTRIYATSETAEKEISGEVIYTNEDANVIQITYTDSANEDIILTIQVTDDTTYITATGRNRDFDNIDKGDRIIAIVTDEGNLYIAENIIIK